MTARIGIQIHPVFTQANKQTRAYSAQEKTDLDSFLLQLQPSSILVLNDFSWAVRFATMLPNTKVIFRKEHPRDGDFWGLTTEDGKPYTPQMHFEGTREHHHPRIMLNLSNEGMGKTVNTPDGKPDYAAITKMVNWLVGCMDIFGAAGVALVTPNFGVGLPDMKWFKADAPEWPLLRPLFEAFKRWPIHALGIHAYWRKDGFTTDDYMNRPRDVAAALDKLGYPVRSMHVTEYGIDAIDGHPGPWMDSYGDTEAGQKEYARLLVKGQRENLNLPFVDGIDTFVWGCYPRWPRYDISKAKHIQDEMIASNMNMPIPSTPPPLDAIVPSDLGNAVAVRIVGDNWYLRAEPTVSAAQIGKLIAGEEVKLYPGTATLADGQSYKVIERIIAVAGEARIAWTAYPTPSYPPQLPSDDNLNTIARLIVIRAKIHAMASLMEDVVRDIHQMELDIAAAEAAKAAEIANAA